MVDHVGTHMDSWFHTNPDAPEAAEAIPLEYCYGDGVVLDMTHKGPGDEITDVDLQEAAENEPPSVSGAAARSTNRHDESRLYRVC